MACTVKYFSDAIDSEQAAELSAIRGMDNAEFARLFPGVKGFRFDGFQKLVGRCGDDVLPVTRKIDYKKQPSKHECNAKCMNGKCNGVCECACGGKNHGRASYV